MYYWTPQRLKELKAKGYKLHACQEAKVTSAKHQAPSTKLQATSNKRQAKKDLTGSCIHDNVGLINQQKGHNEILCFTKI